jgi:hypothetical protein
MQWAAEFVENLTERHRDEFQMGGDTLEYFRRQDGEKMVLFGGHNCDHYLVSGACNRLSEKQKSNGTMKVES